MEENWLIIAGFSNPREANLAAEELKAQGVDCHTVIGEGGEWMVEGPDTADWIFLEVKEEDYDLAIDILQIDPMTIEEVEASYSFNENRERKRKGWFVFWTGLFSCVVILRLLAETL